MAVYAFKVIKHIVMGFCFLMAGYMTVKQIVHFSENLDSSTISYKTFNDGPKDVYPTFTICLQPKDYVDFRKGILLNSSYIRQTVGVTSVEYSATLIGGRDDNSVRNISKVDFQSAMVKQHEVFKSFKATEIKYTTRQINIDITNPNQKWPFYISYQQPQMICFSRMTEFEVGVVRSFEELYLQPLSHLTSRLSNHTYLSIFMHHPGQLARSMITNEIFGSFLKNLNLSLIHISEPTRPY